MGTDGARTRVEGAGTRAGSSLGHAHALRRTRTLCAAADAARVFRAKRLPRPLSPRPSSTARSRAGCGSANALDARGQVRCKQCGYRIFYKVRTDRLTMFEAR